VFCDRGRHIVSSSQSEGLPENEWGDTNEGSVLMLGSSSQRIGVVRSYPGKSQIIREDDPADHVYEVVSGTVCTCKMLREGRRQIAGFYFAGDIFGLESSKKQTVAAEAITNANVRIFKKRALTALASSNLEAADRLLALTARELARKQDHLLLLLSTTAEERIISFLIEMVQRASPREDDLIDLPMARRDIADYLGLTIETVSRVLWDFERRGAIEISGRHSIVLRNQSADGRGERLADFFEGVEGRRPKTEVELQEWLASLEGKAATLFKLTSLSRWGEMGRS
jgi:CRP/FNR family transcriptional regulator, nitrogen fixation regulation protein